MLQTPEKNSHQLIRRSGSILCEGVSYKKLKKFGSVEMILLTYEGKQNSKILAEAACRMKETYRKNERNRQKSVQIRLLRFKEQMEKIKKINGNVSKKFIQVRQHC